MSNQAWVTLATNDSYGLGALVLAHSLRRVGSKHPAVVLITPSVTDAMRERLRAVFAEVVIVDVLDSRDAAHLALLQRPELGITFTKIHCWNLTQYVKGVFLDADTLVVRNCDELFEREELSAAPDVGWPDCFNSGVFVFKPSAETFSNLIRFASERGSFDGGDQGLLNSYFSDWAHGDINKHLPFLYNVTSAAFYSYLPALKHFGQNLKIIHFIGALKPWLQQYNWESRSVEGPEHLRDFLQLWWNLFVANVHTQLDTSMGYIEEDTSAVEQDNADYCEPVLHNIYYEPTLDPDSEFPWHHPDNQITDYDINVPEIDMSQIYDPWNIYRGNVPPSTEQSAPTEKTVDDYQDMRKYAWDYMPPQHETQYTEPSHYEQRAPDSYQHSHNLSENHNVYTHEHVQINFLHNTESHNIEQHSEHNYNNNIHDTQMYTSHNFNEKQTSVENHQTPYNSHEQYIHTNQTENEYIMNQAKYESQENNGITNQNEILPDQEGLKKSGTNYLYLPFQNHKKIEHIYTVMMDHAKMRCQHETEKKVNGYDSDGDSDVSEDIRPRHPYDGFYLRHTMTIDPRGRKICIHEIPFIPRSPTPDSSEEFEDAIETFPEDVNDKLFNDELIHTGVAGNLARVVPGAPLQQEAVDELARRQGWEAGNIDYMGADSFDNIWAKISHTLNQPSSGQPEQGPESATAPQASEPVAVEASKELVEPVSEKQTVLATEQTIEPEISKPAESETSQKAPETAVSLADEVPLPACEPSEKLEEPIPVSADPVPAEVAAEKVPETVNIVDPVESLNLTETKEKTDQDEIPVTALEALKIDEKSNEAPLPETVVEKPLEPAPVPETPAAVVTAEPVVTPAAVSETPAAVVTAEPVVTPAAVSETPAAVVTAEPVVTPTPGSEVPAAVVTAEPVVTPAADPLPVAAPPEPVPAAAEPVAESKPAEAAVTKPEVGSDSPPLANTPSKEEIPGAPAAKSEERRKPAGKLQLQPPVAAEPPTTPDSELEDAAALAHAIIASELRTPTVTAPTPPTTDPAPAPPAQDSRLSVQGPEVPTPPVSSVSLSQIGVKPKPSIAAQIESSVTTKTEATPKSPQTTDAPKKKIIKKVVKKDKEAASGVEAPVPPPRKKEKKPKEK